MVVDMVLAFPGVAQAIIGMRREEESGSFLKKRTKKLSPV
jgi:hypothetical protein